jgi:hypothetical protein
VVREAKVVETRIGNQQGQTASDDIKLGDVTIVYKGDLVGREHIALIQDVTTDRLNSSKKKTKRNGVRRGQTLKKKSSN